MFADESLRAGRLDETLKELQDQVRKDPANPKLRTFLFQLLAVLGQWDRALNQLKVVGEMDASTLPMVQTYQEALQCEVLRQEVFSGHRTPLVFGEPAQWIALLIEALQVTAKGNVAQGQVLRGQAFEAAPATSGSIDGQAFAWIADADPRLGPVLEAIINGRYYWIPFANIRSISIEEPADLRDVVWMPAYFTWSNGGETVGLIPTRYPGSHSHTDPAVRMARKTEWAEQSEDLYLGQGQRLLTTDVNDYPLMDVRLIELATVPPAGEGQPQDAETPDA